MLEKKNEKKNEVQFTMEKLDVRFKYEVFFGLFKWVITHSFQSIRPFTRRLMTELNFNLTF